MQIKRRNSDALVVKELPDGSKLVVDSGRETVFALNATAGAAWDACSTASTLSEIAKKMQVSLHAEVPEELAEQAILELGERHLVNIPEAPEQLSRRAFVAKVGMAAVPLVAALSMSEQRAWAQQAKSGTDPRGNDGKFDWEPNDDRGHDRNQGRVHHHHESPWHFRDPDQ